MEPIIEAISFYPFRQVIISEKEFRIEKYDVLQKQWNLINSSYTDEESCQSVVFELNKDSEIVKEKYIVGYKN